MIRKEYQKPNIELITFRYSDVVAASGFQSSWTFSDEDTITEETGSSWIDSSPVLSGSDPIPDSTSDSVSIDAPATSVTFGDAGGEDNLE